MKILFITGVFENDATGAARFAKLLYQKGGTSFTFMSEDTIGGDRIIKLDCKPRFYQKKMWQYFRISCFKEQLYKYQDEFDAFVFNNSILASGFKTTKPCFVFVHDEKLMKVNWSFRFDFIRKHILRLVEKKVLESGIKIISNSDHISKRLLDTYKINPRNISLIYQGITLGNKMKIHQKNLSEDVIEIMFVKNDYIIGGLIELLEALALLESFKFKLSIYGPHISSIKNLVKSANVEVDLLGIKDNEEVIQAMYDHDILCIPARFEPLGVAVMEGLAVGIPTITTGVGGLPEVTENGQHVWQCEPNDPQSIANQIKACISNAELRKAKSESGRQFVHSNFSFDKVVSRLKEIIGE